MEQEKEYFLVGQRQYTRRERFANWFYYNKWMVAVVILIVGVVGSMIWNVLGIGQVKPDYRIAYVGTMMLPEDCVTALERELAALGEDLNGDGQVCVALTQHVTTSDSNMENMMYSYGAQITVLADITEAQSHFFLLENPESFQFDFQVLAHADGSEPEEDDYSAADKVLRWGDCPVLSGMPLGSYEEDYLDRVLTGDCQELLAGLYLGRRYYHGNAPGELEEYEAFWRLLTEGAE